MSTGQLREGDAVRLLRVLEEAREDDPGPGMPWALLTGLQRLVPCDLDVSYQHHVPAQRATRLHQWVEAGDRFGVQSVGPCPPDDPFWAAWPSSTCSWPQRTGDLHSVVQISDFLTTERARRADPMREVLGDVRHSMLVSLPAPAGEARRVIFMRASDPGFSERDRAVAALARPHLQEIWLDAERRRRRVPALTPREWDVLERAAGGMTYADIAAELFISVGTVRKHMEHVRERLGVHSAAAAAAVALPRLSRPAAPATERELHSAG
jgi:DNA-binding CsgD family transcriptional regulator